MCALRAGSPHIVGLMPMTYRAVRVALSRAGWIKVRQRGSHEVWWSPQTQRTTIVAGRAADTVPAPILSAIRRQTGLDELR